MGFFDFMKKKSAPPPAEGKGAAPPVDKKVAGPAKLASDKKAQTYDRMEALQQLAEMRSPEAALPPSSSASPSSSDPTITDQEEKEVAFQGVVAAGKDGVPAIVDSCGVAIRKGEQLTWQIKLLHEILEDDEYHDALIELLGRFDTEYARNVEPKVQLIQALEEVVSADVREAVAPFLEDVNETVRFHAVQTTFAQNEPQTSPRWSSCSNPRSRSASRTRWPRASSSAAGSSPPSSAKPSPAPSATPAASTSAARARVTRLAGDWR